MDASSVLCTLQRNGTFSDLTIKCGNQTFQVHKSVVCTQSKWFLTACQDNRWVEGLTGVIELKATECKVEDDDFSCDNSKAVSLLIDYLYHNDYDLEVKLGSQGSTVPDKDKSIGRLSMHARLYAMAPKYDVPSLQAKALKKFKHAVDQDYDKQDFADAIFVGFRSTVEKDVGLRDVLIESILEDAKSLTKDPHIKKAITGVGLSYKLLEKQSASSTPHKGIRRCCSDCEFTFYGRACSNCKSRRGNRY